MSNEKISCRIAIQTCVGHFPDGRERHRTFSLRHVRPDVSMETIRDIIRALAPLLKYPITKVTKVTKREIFSDEEKRDAGSAKRNAEDAALYAATPAPQANAESVTESARIIPFPVFPAAECPGIHMVIMYNNAKSSHFAATPMQKSFHSGRAPPEFNS